MSNNLARQGAAKARALWLRYDLRLDDNPALQAACKGAESLLPIYVFDPASHNVPTLAGARKSSARRARFLLESLSCLRSRLEGRGSGLAIAIGKPHEVLPRFCSDCGDVYVTQSMGTEEKADENRVAKHLDGKRLERIWGGTLYMPEECGCQPSSTPLLFTSFRNKAEGRGFIRDPLDAPARLPPLPEPAGPGLQQELQEALKFLPSLEQLGYPSDEAQEALQDDPRGVMTFEGGEEPALQRLQTWMFDDDNLKDYFEIRNGMLGEGYSSKLSPWLALGCISPRRIWQEAKRYEKERKKNKSTYWLVFELIWRDFFVYMGNTYGHKLYIPGGITGDNKPWSGTAEVLARWKEGCTGDPLVDANMRELKATGFMSNRGRQNVASYLIFDLDVDWRYGAAHFEELLLDYDPCSNWGNWVAAAGLTGQRVNRFNTRKQLNDYDPKREYVDHWLKGGDAAVPVAPRHAAGGSQSMGNSGGAGKGYSTGGKGRKGKGASWKSKDNDVKRPRRWDRISETLQGA